MYLDWIGLVINLLGVWLNGNRNILCWPVWIIGGFVWTFHWIPLDQSAAIVMTFCYMGFNIWGWRKWSKENG